MSEKFAILTTTFCDGTIFGCYDDEHNPVMFDSEEEAWKEIADDKIEELDQFIKGERELDQTNFGCDEWVALVTLEDGKYTAWDEQGNPQCEQVANSEPNH